MPEPRDDPVSHDDPVPRDDSGLVSRVRVVADRERRRAEERLARYGDRPLIAVGLRIWSRDRESAGTLVGSALAFRMFLFFVPLLLFLVGLAGVLAGRLDATDVNESAGVTGELANQIRQAFAQRATTTWLALASGIVGIASTGRSLTKVLSAASSLAWRLPVRTKASVRVIGAVVGMVAGLGLCLAIVNRIRLQYGLPAASVSFLGVFAVYVAIWIVIFRLLPAATPDPGSQIPGAVMVSLALTALQAVSQLYLPNQFARSSQLYGAIGVTVVTLGWFFFLGRAVVLGMAVNAVLFERYGSVTTVVFGLPLLRALPRRSARVRRIFGIDGSPVGAVDSPLRGDAAPSDRHDAQIALTEDPSRSH